MIKTFEYSPFLGLRYQILVMQLALHLVPLQMLGVCEQSIAWLAYLQLLGLRAYVVLQYSPLSKLLLVLHY